MEQHSLKHHTSNSCAPIETRNSPRSSRGFSLVEVLISIVILTIGVLGMVGMQAASIRANREAKLQSTAIVLARELAEMMRGNRAIGVAAAASNPYLVTTMTATTPSYCLNVANGTCANATEIANAEMTEWLARVNAELPGARVVSCYDATPFDSSGLPQWACTGTGAIAVIKMGWTRRSTDLTAKGASALELTSDSTSSPSIVVPVTAGSSI